MIYLGGWQSGFTDGTSKLLQAQAPESHGWRQMLLAADQEGSGATVKNGFTRIPSALTQSGWAPEEITRQATEWGRS